MLTTTQKNNIEWYNNVYSLIYRCMLSNDRKKRIKYGKDLIKEIRKSQQNSDKISEEIDNMITKLVQAAKTISLQQEWAECLVTAIGSRTDILHAANTARNVLEKYKNKKKED